MVAKLLNASLYRLRKLFANPYAGAGLSVYTIKKLKHQNAGTMRTITLLGMPLQYISPQELVHGIDEIFVEGIYDQVLQPGDWVIDCGANIGLSVIKWKQLCAQCEVLAFEPDERNFAILKANVAARQLDDVVLEKRAVWIREQPLFFEDKGNMSSKIGDHQSEGTVQVQAIRLKDYLVRDVAMLKIDIEGAEYSVLKDIADSLHRVQRMFIEYHGRLDQQAQWLELLDIIHKAGFATYIKEAAAVYPHPFTGQKKYAGDWDIQQNIFCWRTSALGA